MPNEHAARTERDLGDDAPGRLLFRYVTVEEWRDYRSIVAVFAGTSFAEFSPDDVSARLAADGTELDVAVVADRLERLRMWGNLTVSSSIGNPASLDDYYRRRNRYLITPAAQEVHDVVEGVLGRVDDVRDVSTGRLGSIRAALDHLHTLDLEAASAETLADAVRAVFDPMAAFSTEITQFFAAINQWQSRYDLSPDEFRFFAEVLVSYVAERLDEIERMSRPIGRALKALEPSIPRISSSMATGLAGRVRRAGLDDTVSLTHTPGSSPRDWQHLGAWFLRSGDRPSRIEQLGGDAVSAIRTLTQNLTRLSREGVGATSRRADFLRLAQLFQHSSADGPDIHTIAAAAFGLFPSSHLGVVADDAGDPVSPATAWADAPRARVPVSIRERGDRANRGRPSPLRDRRREREVLLRRREDARRARERVDAELLAVEDFDGAALGAPAFARVQQLVARTMPLLGVDQTVASHVEDGVRCTLRREHGASVTVHAPEGDLTFEGLLLRIERADEVGVHV